MPSPRRRRTRPPPPPELPLRNLRREAFAQARAAGLTGAAAHERAGYAGRRDGASHLNKKAEVAARIKWLKARSAGTVGSDSESTIVRLLDMADDADLSTAAGVREAREALEDAWRRYAELCKSRATADKAGG